MSSRSTVVVVVTSIFATVGLHASAEERVVFNRDIRPLLADRCFACHGPHDAKRQADLRLDVAGGDHGPFQLRDGRHPIQPGDPDSSEIWRRLTTDDPAMQMPPGDSGKRPLNEAQKKLVRQWILQGARYEDFWAFVPPRPQQVPSVSNSHWPNGRIDRFVLENLDRRQLSPKSLADKRTLIRRLTLDLTGLPPTLDAIHNFEQDPEPDATLRLIDRLLATPQYGEHMARYWLDLVRFADTNGMHHDHYRELTPFRDWVIRSLNNNIPFDQFVTQQLAGDLMAGNLMAEDVTAGNPTAGNPTAGDQLSESTLDLQIASGYNRLHMVMDKGTNPPLESYTRNVVDQVVAFGTVFLGMTLECSVCHDHKYDPVTQTDFYQLFAFFNNIDGDPETPGQQQQPPLLRMPTPEQIQQRQTIEARMSALKSEVDELQQKLAKLQSDANSGNTAASEQVTALGMQIKQKEEELARQKSTLDQLERSVPLTLVMKERLDLRPAYILKRGAYDQPGREVSRNTPSFLPPLESSADVKTRLDLARWVTDKRNPLTARVTVNRVWQQLLGVGLVKTSEDFGAQGEFPSHPELLDDLANTFADSGWNIKSLIRSIAASQTYQQSSQASPHEYRADVENRHLARGSRFRLDAEIIRDQVLYVSGLLNGAMYGRSVKPPQPTDLWKTVSMVSSNTYSFKADTGDKVYRRSFYTFWKRAMPPPQMTIFDAPTRESCTSRRERTNTPVQALMMMNESQYFEAARYFAQQLLAEKESSDDDRLRAAFESITSHLPGADEMADLRAGLESLRHVYREDAESVKSMTADLALASDAQRIELAAYTMVVNSLFNLHAAKTRE